MALNDEDEKGYPFYTAEDEQDDEDALPKPLLIIFCIIIAGIMLTKAYVEWFPILNTLNIADLSPF